MNIEHTVLLGIIQGLTEFLPVSSSGHLVIFQHLIGLKNPELLLDISLHIGTLLAIFIFFRSDIRAMITEGGAFLGNVLWRRKPAPVPLKGMNGRRGETRQLPYAALSLWVLVSIIPTALIGILFNRLFHEMFGSTLVVGIMLMVTGTILGASRLIPDKAIKKRSIGLVTALAVGLAQGAAITPGISRSGATIVCGLLCGLDRELAGRFSFLISIPAIIGALVMQFDMTEIGEIGYAPFMTGIVISFVTGLIALKITMNYVRKGKLHYFLPYCFFAGIVALLIK
ncbi:MAG TPA: undecaprenyl-diphosphate phosphatase [Desulfatiglandales bacterium]|nr:undecaprenyl-diphosphate phosphatase [Desulfatiglandales bacterium]